MSALSQDSLHLRTFYRTHRTPKGKACSSLPLCRHTLTTHHYTTHGTQTRTHKRETPSSRRRARIFPVRTHHSPVLSCLFLSLSRAHAIPHPHKLTRRDAVSGSATARVTDSDTSASLVLPTRLLWRRSSAWWRVRLADLAGAGHVLRRRWRTTSRASSLVMAGAATGRDRAV